MSNASAPGSTAGSHRKSISPRSEPWRAGSITEPREAVRLGKPVDLVLIEPCSDVLAPHARSGAGRERAVSSRPGVEGSRVGLRVGSVGEPDKNEPRIHDSSDQHRDEEVCPVLVPEDQDHHGEDEQCARYDREVGRVQDPADRGVRESVSPRPAIRVPPNDVRPRGRPVTPVCTRAVTLPLPRAITSLSLSKIRTRT